MQYLGGKSTTGAKIAAEIERVRPSGSPYWEPFVGGANVIPRVTGERYASDSNAALITLYTAYQGGWRPPEQVDESLYADLKRRQDPNDPLTAFAGFGVSYGGKWFGGFARSRRVDLGDREPFAKVAARGLDRKLAACSGVPFVQLDYREAAPRACTIYADPPYATGTQYSGVAPFDSAEFFDWARKVSRDNVLLISEYTAPEDFEIVAEFPIVGGRLGHTPERLFRWRG